MKSSGLQGASAKIYTGPCRLLGVSLTADEQKTLTITVRDGVTDAGTQVAFGKASSGSILGDALTSGAEGTIYQGTHNYVIKFSRDDNMFCDNGLYAKLSDENGGDYIIYFEPM